MELTDQTRLVRRLRIALAGVSMLVGLCLIGFLGVLFYWNTYLLGNEGVDPFTRGPYVGGRPASAAELRFLGPEASQVKLTAVAPDGRVTIATNGRFAGLTAGQRYIWTAAVDGIGRASGWGDRRGDPNRDGRVG